MTDVRLISLMEGWTRVGNQGCMGYLIARSQIPDPSPLLLPQWGHHSVTTSREGIKQRGTRLMFFTWALRVEMISIKGHRTWKRARSTSPGPCTQKVTVRGFSKSRKKNKNPTQPNHLYLFLGPLLHFLHHTLRLQSNADSFSPGSIVGQKC